MFNYGNIQLKVCGITDQKSLEVIQKYSVRTVGLVSNYLYGPNTLSTEEIHNLTIASYNLKLNPILLIGNIHMPKIIDIIKQVEIKEVCVSNQYKIEDIELLNNSTNSKISISINYENFDYNFYNKVQKGFLKLAKSNKKLFKLINLRVLQSLYILVEVLILVMSKRQLKLYLHTELIYRQG